MRSLQAINLEQWAQTLDARSVMPAVMRRLVHATSLNVSRVDFPAYEGVQRPGWDGIVMATAGTAFVPEGTSLWEIGTNAKVREKADDDYNARVTDPAGFQPRDCEFVFVTPRKWIGKRDWCNEKNSQGIWRNVRAYDSDDLEQWIEMAPAVGVWLARQLGLRTYGVWDVEHHWDGLAALSTPELKPAVMVASRAGEEEQFIAWLEETPGALTIESRAPTEVIDFVTAALMRLDEKRRELALASSMIVDSREAFDVLRDSSTPLLFIAQPHLALEPELIASAVRRGHRIVWPTTKVKQSKVRCLALPRIYRHDLEAALEQCGFSSVDAEKVARGAGGSTAILKRRLGRYPDGRLPSWAADSGWRAAMPFLWIGGWHDNAEGDRVVLSELACEPYDRCERAATDLAECQEPLLVRAVGNWSLLSKDDAWMLLGQYASEEELRRFLDAAKAVLIEDDPQFDLAPDERLYAAVRGHVCRYSGRLRKSIAETLALLASLHETVGLPASWAVPQRIEGLVQQLLPRGCSWKRWASLRETLPLLAEAAPDAFLAAVECDLASPEPELPKLLAEEGDGLFGGIYHAGLLWAFEGIAWSPAHLSRACRLLLELASRDPGSKSMNRPANSLAEILSPWYPQTAASAQQRVQVLDNLLLQNSAQARRLLMTLLPETMATATPTHRPYWRDWALQWKPGTTNADYWLQVEACGQRLIASAGQEPESWQEIVQEIERIPPQVHGQIIKGLQQLAIAKLPAVTCQGFATLLRNVVSRHRSHEEAHWALPKGVVDDLDRVREQFESDDPVLRHIWLFDRHPRAFFDSAAPHEEMWRKLQDAQTAAFREILNAGGLDVAVRFARQVESPENVGSILATMTSDVHTAEILPSLLVGPDIQLRRFASGFAMNRHEASGWAWFDALPSIAWEQSACVQLLSCLPFEREAWDRAENAGKTVADGYWSSTSAWNPRLSGEDVERAARELLCRGRAFQALQLVSMGLHGQQDVPTEVLLSLLDGAISGRSEHDACMQGNASYNLLEVFKQLQKRQDIEESRLAGIEWALLPLFRFDDASPATLHRWLAANPAFFAEVMSCHYRSRNEEVSEEPASELDVAKAKHAYHLLRSWRRLPGTAEDGTINEAELRTWVTEARSRAEASGRLEVCDITIGDLFSKAPTGTDGAWPCEAVRSVFEAGASELMLRGFEVGIFKSVGVVTKMPHEGGKQERQRADRYENYARSMEITAPVTAASLRRVAERFRRDGRREDEAAQWDG